MTMVEGREALMLEAPSFLDYVLAVISRALDCALAIISHAVAESSEHHCPCQTLDVSFVHACQYSSLRWACPLLYSLHLFEKQILYRPYCGPQ